MSINGKTLEDLNTEAATAIREMESVCLRISKLKESAAFLTAPSTHEGRSARLGAVRGALLAADRRRANELAWRYMNEPGAEEHVSKTISDMLRYGL